MTTANEVINFDPNFTLGKQMAIQTVKLTFGSWNFRKTVFISVIGSYKGLSVIERAVELAYSQLDSKIFDFIDDENEITYITLAKSVDGNTTELEVPDEILEEEDWLKELIIAAEIINIIPEVK